MKWSSKGTSPFDNDCQTWSLNFLFPERKQAQFFHFSTFFRIPAIRISSPSARVWIRQRTSSPKTMLLCEKKNLGKNETVLWNIYSLAHQTLSKKVSSKDTQRFRTHRRERDHAFEKIRLHINWVAGSQKKWAPSLTFYSFLKFWRQQNFTGWGVDFDKKQKAQRPDQFQKPNLLKLVGKWTVSRF